MTITPLGIITRSRYVNCIRICVARSWRPKKFQSESFDGIHYILVDEKGDAIHAIVDEHDYMHTPIMKVGCMYDVYHVHVKGVGSGYKVIDRDLEIGFNGMSTIVPLEPDACAIPKFAYNFVVFNEIEDCFNKQQKMEKEKKRVLLADVYGCIKEVIPPRTLFIAARGAYETICEVILENHRRETVKVTLWSDIAKKFDIKAVEESDFPTFAAITSLRFKMFKGNITPTGTNHTCIIFNPHLPQFASYSTEFNKPGDKVRISKFYSGQQKDETWKTILQLRSLDAEEYKDRIVFCCARILRFPSHSGWWYNSCSVPRCSKQMKQKLESSDFSCPVHHDQLSVPAYRVYMTIKDDSDQITLTLIGRQAETLFGYSCLDLLNKREYSSFTEIPCEIEAKVGGTFLFELKIGYNNEFVVRTIHPDPTEAEGIEGEGGNSSKSFPKNHMSLAGGDDINVLTPAKLSEKKRNANTEGPLDASPNRDKKLKRLEKDGSSHTDIGNMTGKEKVE